MFYHLAVSALLCSTVAKSPTKPILFLHLHKGAGTFLCDLAKANNMRTSHNNCLVQKNQRCCGGDSVKKQIQYAQKTPYNFVANENYLYEAMVPGMFTYVTILRDSWSRYISHFRHVCRLYNMPLRKKTFFAWLKGQPDNWNLRHICGTRCMFRDKFSLTESDYNYALNRLQKFDHVVHFDSNTTRFAKETLALCDGLKWNECPLDKKNNAPPQKTFDFYVPFSNFNSMTTMDDCLFKNLSFSQCLGASVYFNSRSKEYNSPCGKKCTKY